MAEFNWEGFTLSLVKLGFLLVFVLAIFIATQRAGRLVMVGSTLIALLAAVGLAWTAVLE